MKPIVKQKQSTVQDIMNKAQAGGSSSILDIEINTAGTISLSWSGTAITGELGIATTGFINMSFSLDYLGCYPNVSELSATFDITIDRDGSNYYLQNAHLYFQGSTINQDISNNNFNLFFPVKAGDTLNFLIGSKQLDQGKAGIIISNLSAKYILHEFV